MSKVLRRSSYAGTRLPQVLRAVGVAAVLLVCGAQAAMAADPAARVARLSDFSGAVSFAPVSYTHLTLPTKEDECRSRWSPSH